MDGITLNTQDNGLMTENTLQTVIMIFTIAMAVVVCAVVGTFCYLVIRDGNDPLVSQAFSDLANVVQNSFSAIAAIIVGKPIASGILQFFQGKAIQASTQNAPLTPSAVSVNTVPTTPPASSQSAPGPFNSAT